MSVYSNILLAIDLSLPTTEYITKRTVELAKINKAKITLLHVVEKINTYGEIPGEISLVDLEEKLFDEARLLLAEIGNKYQIPLTRQIIKTGSSKELILAQAKEMTADLIVVGSHGRHGIRLLLGSTANSVLHHANCDVLAIRIKNSD